jgi:5-methylcytosine-specific restriction endonuclease McrA
MSTQRQRKRLRDKEWEAKREEILERDNFECVNCGEYAETVHHILGRKDPRLFFDERFLCAVCGACHSDEANTIAFARGLLWTLRERFGYDFSGFEFYTDEVENI